MISKPDDSGAEAKIKRRVPFRLLISIIVVLGAVVALAGQPILHSFADAAAPAKPTGFGGFPHGQGVELMWDAASDVTAYEIEQTDLTTGNVQLSAPEAVTSGVTIGSLEIGHWYRFRLIPLNEATAGPPSLSIDIRTEGFSGSYSSYYALGDSYSSGEGAPPYSGVASCYRSAQSYAYLLGNGAPSPDMIACSGASTDNIDKTVENSDLPGTQLQELQSGPQDNSLITISIGGNDIGFAAELQKCITAATDCTSDQATISQKITALEPRLIQVYQEIRQASPAADIVVVGYPLLVAAANLANCHDSVTQIGLSADKLTMIRSLATQLNNAIGFAALLSGVSFASGVNAFAGHEACTSDESAEWINEITGLNDNLHGSFHPNQLGYAAYAQAVNDARAGLYQYGQVRPDASLYTDAMQMT